MCIFQVNFKIGCLAHVIEEEREAETGVEFLTSCRSVWQNSTMSHHISWHFMLFYLGKLFTDVFLCFC